MKTQNKIAGISIDHESSPTPRIEAPIDSMSRNGLATKKVITRIIESASPRPKPSIQGRNPEPSMGEENILFHHHLFVYAKLQENQKSKLYIMPKLQDQ